MAKAPIKAPPAPASPTPAGAPAPTPPPSAPVTEGAAHFPEGTVTPPGSSPVEPGEGTAPGFTAGDEHFPDGTTTAPGEAPVVPPAPLGDTSASGGAREPVTTPAPAPTPPPGSASLDEVIEAVEDIEPEPTPATSPELFGGKGDHDNNGKAGGAAPAQKADKAKSNAELGSDVGKSHAQSAGGDPALKASADAIKKQIKTVTGGTLPNGKDIDDEFVNAYSAAYDAECEQIEADEMSTEERIARIERTLGLRSPQ